MAIKNQNRNHGKYDYQLLFPNILGFKGGEQVYGYFLLCALDKLYPNSKFKVFLKRERACNQPDSFSSKFKFYCFGSLPRLLQILVLSIKFVGVGILQKPHLVITSHVNYAPICYVLNFLTGTPYWIVAHGLEVWELRGPLRQTAMNNAARILAVSEYTRNRILTEQRLDHDKVVVLPNTFDPSRFKITSKSQFLLRKYGLKQNQPIILTVTRLTPYKGYEQILRALPIIRRSMPNVHYLLVGKGNDRDRIESLIEELSLQSCVTLTGFIPDKELCDYYNLCDVFAMPSRGEGFGIVFLEALACGKPVLAGNCDGSVDTLLKGSLGCLVDPNDINQIAHSLVQILSGLYPNTIIYKPQKLRDEVINKFEISKFRQSIAKLISMELLQ